MNRSLLVAFAILAGGCAEPTHLGHDFGRAYTAAFTAQPDLTRATVLDRAHPLSGVEAQAIRLNVQAETTEAKDAESDFEIGD